jgi:methyl-accepting chemotaxis protein
MQTVLEWLGAQANTMTLLQVLLDLLLAILVITVLARKPRVLKTSGYEELTASLERIIKDTKELSSDFETNLQERHRLIQQITSQLDARVEEARSVATQLESMQQSAARMAQQEPVKRSADHQEILRLTRKGLSAENVAKQLKKPLGEVELILKLNRLSGS